MSIFVIIIDEGFDEVAELINQEYPNNHLHYLENVYFVSSDSIPETVAINIGIKGESRVASGAVFQLSGAYAGYTTRSLWDWLTKEESRE